MNILIRQKELLWVLFSIFFILILWRVSYFLSCFTLFLPLLFMIIIAYSFIELKLKQKKCLKECYFKENTIIAKIITSPYFISVFYIVLSLIYAFSFIYTSITFGLWFYIILIVFVVLMFYIYKVFLNLFRKIINEKYCEIIIREICIKIGAVFLLLLYISYFLYVNEPNYIKESLELTINKATNSISSNCLIVDFIVRLQAEAESTFWFLLKNSTNLINDTLTNNFIWISFIIINALSIIGLNRFIFQVIYIVHIYFKDNGAE